MTEFEEISPKRVDAEFEVVVPQSSGSGVTRDEFNALNKKVDNEIARAQDAESAIYDAVGAVEETLGSNIFTVKNSAGRYDGNSFSSKADTVTLTTTGVNTQKNYTVNFPIATQSYAGAISAADKKKLDSLSANDESALSERMVVVENKIIDIVDHLGALKTMSVDLVRKEGQPLTYKYTVGNLSAQQYKFGAFIEEEISDDITFELVKGDVVVASLGVMPAGEFEIETTVDIADELNDIDIRISLPVAQENTVVNIYFYFMPGKTVAEAIAGLATKKEFDSLRQSISDNSRGIATLNTTIINYNQRYGIAGAVTKQEVIEGLLNKSTADKGTIVTYYAEDGWHTIQYKLSYYNPTQAVKESNWVEHITRTDLDNAIVEAITNTINTPV